MKFYRIIICAAAMLALSSCVKDESIPEGDPSIVIDKTALTFEKVANPKTIQMTANREWKVIKDDKATWITITPASGKASASAQTITIAADENTGEERSADLTFTTGSATTSIKITQKGAINVVYFNNFDREAAASDASKKWPYIYSTDCWKNETGTGVANVRYITESNGASIRNNTNSTGSGVNNIFFGSNARFCVKNIKLSKGVASYKLSFYGIRSVYDAVAGASIFDHNVFKLYISNDGSKWLQVDYVFEGGDPDKAWGQASTTFTVPAGTDSLCIGVPALSEASTYRLDDVKLIEYLKDTTAVDFTKGVEITEFKDAEPFDPSKIESKTVSEFITLADKSNYYKLSGSISSFNSTYCSFDLTDTTGKVYVYRLVDSCKTKYSSILKDGDVVTLVGKYDYYSKDSKHEVVDAIILSYQTPAHKTITATKVADAVAAEIGDTVVFNNALVVAAAKTGYLVTDSLKTDYILVYQKTEGADTPVAVGDVVSVKSVRAETYSMPQLVSPKTRVLSSGTTVNWPTPEDITSTFDSFTSTTIKYISYKGTLSINGSYYNVAVDGASSNTGSLLPVAAVESLVGVPNTTFEGYYIYTSGSSKKYIYIIYTKATASADPYLVVNPKSASVAATAGSTSISVTSNVDWTVTSDNADFTVSPASGNGNGTITVSYPENATESTKTANITVATATDTVNVVITQAKPGAATYTWTLASGQITTAASTYKSGDVTWAYSSAGYIGWDSSNGRGVQIGKSSAAQASYTVSTEYFASPKTISSITVNASMASGGNAKLTISVDGVDVLTNQALTTTATDYKVDGINKSGKIEIKFTASAKAYYLKSVTVGY